VGALGVGHRFVVGEVRSADRVPPRRAAAVLRADPP